LYLSFTLTRPFDELRQSVGSRRMSMGYFLHPNYDAEIACLPTCSGPGNSPRYALVRAGDMMRQKLEARARARLGAEDSPGIGPPATGG
jgi:isopenicillin N synthase-like dioxygenase